MARLVSLYAGDAIGFARNGRWESLSTRRDWRCHRAQEEIERDFTIEAKLHMRKSAFHQNTSIESAAAAIGAVADQPKN